MISTHIQIKTGKRRIPELLAIAAMTLLLIHIADGYITLITNHGFLPMSIDKKPFGISTFGISTFGISSILFFFMAFGIEIREKRRTRLTTTLLIVGGALILALFWENQQWTMGDCLNITSIFDINCSRIYNNGAGYTQSIWRLE